MYFYSMENLVFSFVIPVYNRPQEIDELLNSLKKLDFQKPFEIVIVEDGSTLDCKAVIENYKSHLNISYYFKNNSGPGDSRNFGMHKATGNYFVILDSDCLLPPNYLQEVEANLTQDYVDCFGGPDAAKASFTNIQKAISFAMTSFISTGGIRGGKSDLKDFQPRSFNMGLSKKAFLASDGFGNIHPGEDPDLSIRLKKLGFKTVLFPKAYVYHKRRISWSKFYQQVYKFGLVRPILNAWHPETTKITYWFPSVFSIGLIVALVSMCFGFILPIFVFIIYSIIAFIAALSDTKKISIACMSVFAIFIQFFGYGFGFLKSYYYIHILKNNPKTKFPILFFNNA